MTGRKTFFVLFLTIKVGAFFELKVKKSEKLTEYDEKKKIRRKDSNTKKQLDRRERERARK